MHELSNSLHARPQTALAAFADHRSAPSGNFCSCAQQPRNPSPSLTHSLPGADIWPATAETGSAWVSPATRTSAPIAPWRRGAGDHDHARDRRYPDRARRRGSGCWPTGQSGWIAHTGRGRHHPVPELGSMRSRWRGSSGPQPGSSGPEKPFRNLPARRLPMP